MSAAPTIQHLRDVHVEAVQALNEASVPHVNSLSVTGIRDLVAASWLSLVALDGRELAGFMLVFEEGADYASVNYRYFNDRYASFAYIDRVAVDARYRRLGVGNGFYAHLLDRCRDHKAMLTCEVNLEPPNPGSMAFHRQLGFETVAQQSTEGGRKRVALLTHELDS